MKNFFASFLQLIYPNVCVCCAGYLTHQEHQICDFCTYYLPKYEENDNLQNQLNKKFWGRLPLEFAVANYVLKEGNHIEKMLYELKYNGNKTIGLMMGQALGRLIESLNLAGRVDMIVPVPLHPKKEHIRGFNQAEIIARGMAEVLGLPVEKELLFRTKNNTTQTQKSRFSRHDSTAGIFSINHNLNVAGKCILLVDDVITTGSTCINCGTEILKLNDVKLCVAVASVAQ